MNAPNHNVRRLTAKDFANLAKRWIPPELAEAAGLFRVNSPEGAALVGRNGGPGDYSGIAIPYRHLTGERGTREYRLRRDHPDLEMQADGSTRERGKYLSPPGRGSMLFVPFGREFLGDPQLPIVLTEGEFKTLALARLAMWGGPEEARASARFLPVGLPGVWNWRGTVGKANDAEGHRQAVKGPIPDLDLIVWAKRRVIILFDSDAARNQQVRAARRALASELERRGADVRIVELPDLAGFEKTGADDFLAHPEGGPECLLKLIESALPVKPPTVEELLAASGISALSNGSSQDEVQAALRALADAPGITRMDKLGLASVREAVIKQLASIGTRAPAAITDAALGVTHKEDTETARLFADPDPWPERVDGAILLDEILSALKRYIVLAAEAAFVIALWCLHTHAAEASDVFPRLTFTSPEKRCGKTRCQEVIELLVSRPLRTGSISAAAVFRLIEEFKPTLLIDEADTFFSDREELRGIVNLGHRVGGYVPRCEGDDNAVRLFRAWGPLSLACIGSLPDTTTDRSIEIRMRRKKPEEKVARFRVKSARLELTDLPRKAARWAKDNLEILRRSSPEFPNGLNDRQADNWEPLLAIADLAGGPWPERAREAALALSGEAVRDEQSARVTLLMDLRELFDSRKADCLTSKEIVRSLGEMEERAWPEWKKGKPITTRQLAGLLKPLGIAPGKWRAGPDFERGYLREEFTDAWERYATLSDPPHPPQALYSTTCKIFDPPQIPFCGGSKNPVSSNEISVVADVADEKGGSEAFVWPPLPEGTYSIDPDELEDTTEGVL